MGDGNFSYRIEQRSSAPAAVVYDVLLDVERWAEWMPRVRRASWERRGAADTEEGAIRRTTLGVATMREQILTGQRPSRHAYIMLPGKLSGLLLKDYRANVQIDDLPQGCSIVWQGTFVSRIPGLGVLIQSVVRSNIAKATAALAQEAERRA